MKDNFDLEEFEKGLLSKGYLLAIREPAGLKHRCDLVAFGLKGSGQSLVSVFEFRNAEKLNLELEAAKLDALRGETGADQCFLVTNQLIYQLSSNGFDLERILEIPELSTRENLINDDRLAFHLISQRIYNLKLNAGKLPISQILHGLVFENGLVRWDSPAIKMSGKAFRDAMIEVYRKRASKLLGHYFASKDLQYVLQNILTHFPVVSDVFDPFFGLGFSSFSVVDTMLAQSGEENFEVKGLEINSEVIGEANYLCQTFPDSVFSSIVEGDSIEVSWPKASLLVSELPIGVKLPRVLSIEGITSNSLEELAIHKSAIGVESGQFEKGAILVTSRGWLTKASSKALRDKLADMQVVKALIGLPAFHMPLTSVPLLLVVLQKNSVESTIGELGSDWKSHISGQEGNLYELL